MEENKLNKIIKLDFYKKKCLWACGNTSSKPISSNDKKTDGTDVQQHNTGPKKRKEKKVNPARVQNTAPPLVVSPIVTTEECAGPSNVPYEETRLISSKLNLFIKLSNIEKNKSEESIASNDPFESKMDMTESISGKIIVGMHGTTDSGGVDSDLNISMVKLHSQENLSKCKYINRNKNCRNLKVNSPKIYQHDMIDDEIHDIWVRMYKSACAANNYHTTFEPARPSTYDGTRAKKSNFKGGYVNFMRRIHTVPHSSMNDISAYTNYTIIRPEQMTEYKILNMKPKELEANLYQVSDIWTKILLEIMERSFHTNDIDSRRVSFVPRVQIIPLSLLHDINLYNTITMTPTLELTRYKLAEMTPKQLLTNVHQLSKVWRKMISVADDRNVRKQKMPAKTKASAAESKSKNAARRRRNFTC